MGDADNNGVITQEEVRVGVIPSITRMMAPEDDQEDDQEWVRRH